MDKFLYMLLYYCMKNNLIKCIGLVLGVYTALNCISHSAANFMLSIFLILLIPGLIIFHMFKNELYKTSINIVSKQFVFNRNTIANDHCSVVYIQDQMITVTDKIAFNNKKELRTFTIRHSNKLNVNKCWNKICRVFDSFITLDALSSFLSYDTTVDVRLIKSEKQTVQRVEKNIQIDASNSGPKFVDIANIRPDSYVDGTRKQQNSGDNFINIDNIKESEKTIEREIEAPKLVDMSEALDVGPNKIDINTADAAAISILPGINIVGAKKIVEYRDLNGLFKNVDDFIKVSGVKEHFIEKIKTMVFAGKPEVKQNNDEDYGRIVDF